MAEGTKIEWTATRNEEGLWVPGCSFSPWLGCSRVSPGCDNCYAASWAKRTGQAKLWEGERRRTTKAYWRKPLAWEKTAQARGSRIRVFCASLSDVFDNQVPPEWREDLWTLIAATPHLDWLILTKRPQNIYGMLPRAWGNGWPNVWLGTTVENQTEAERRIPFLRIVPATVHFLSCEPLIGPIEPDLRSISWVICGGESGHGARDMDHDWARQLRDQCRYEKTAFFMKQMARKATIPDDLMVRQFPTPRHIPCNG